jgi:hypothetical protein
MKRIEAMLLNVAEDATFSSEILENRQREQLPWHNLKGVVSTRASALSIKGIARVAVIGIATINLFFSPENMDASIKCEGMESRTSVYSSEPPASWQLLSSSTQSEKDELLADAKRYETQLENDGVDISSLLTLAAANLDNLVLPESNQEIRKIARNTRLIDDEFPYLEATKLNS